MERASLLLNLDLEGVHCERLEAVHRELCAGAAINRSHQGSQDKKMKITMIEVDISRHLLVKRGIMGDFLKFTESSSFTDFSLTVIR